MLRHTLQGLMADGAFAVMRSQVRLAARLNLPAMSTGRPFGFYRKVFFGGKSEAEVLVGRPKSFNQKMFKNLARPVSGS